MLSNGVVVIAAFFRHCQPIAAYRIACHPITLVSKCGAGACEAAVSVCAACAGVAVVGPDCIGQAFVVIGAVRNLPLCASVPGITLASAQILAPFICSGGVWRARSAGSVWISSRRLVGVARTKPADPQAGGAVPLSEFARRARRNIPDHLEPRRLRRRGSRMCRGWSRSTNMRRTRTRGRERSMSMIRGMRN